MIHISIFFIKCLHFMRRKWEGFILMVWHFIETIYLNWRTLVMYFSILIFLFLLFVVVELFRQFRPKKSCLVVLHHPPLIFENWKKVFTVQKYTAHNFQNSKKSFFFLWKFWSFKNNFQIVVVNLLTFLYWFKTCIKGFFGIVDLFAPFWGI